MLIDRYSLSAINKTLDQPFANFCGSKIIRVLHEELAKMTKVPERTAFVFSWKIFSKR